MGAEPFIWLIRRKATYMQACYPEGCLCVAVGHAQALGSVLVTATARPHPEGFSLAHDELVPIPSQNESAEIRVWKIEPIDTITPVTPADVSLWIEQALDLGWMPRQSGKPFEVRVVGNCLEKM